jgi:hypothetical protein
MHKRLVQREKCDIAADFRARARTFRRNSTEGRRQAVWIELQAWLEIDDLTFAVLPTM